MPQAPHRCRRIVRRSPRFLRLGALTLLAAAGLAGCAAPAASPAPNLAPAATTPGTSTSPSPAPRPLGTPAPQPGSTSPPGWRLVWNDEFNGSTVDTARWTVLDQSTMGNGNNELACLMDRPRNVQVANGVLSLIAHREAKPIDCGPGDSRFPNGRKYSSGFLESKTKAEFQYGRFEVRAKTPTAAGTTQGLWPAFWLRPANGKLGELDVLEQVGSGAANPVPPNRVRQTIYYDYSDRYPPEGATYVLPQGDFASAFHTYAVEWEPGAIRWYVDGQLSYSRTLATTPWLDRAFSQPFFLRLNLAVGGDWPGPPDASTAFPAQFQVDYVRVYQR